MDDKGFAYEQRKTPTKPNNSNKNYNEIEYVKGGEGDGDKFSRFGFVKSQVYSKECHSDPQNPGKIICKETTNRSGYNPFDPNDPNNNYNKYSENVYSRDVNNGYSVFNSGNNVTPNPSQQNEEPSLWNKLRSGVKGLFGGDENKNNQNNQNTNYNWNANFKNNNNVYHQNESFERINEHMNQIFNEIGRTFSDDFFGPSLITNFFSDPFFNNNLVNNPNNNFNENNNNHYNNSNFAYNNLNPENRFVDPIGIPGVFGLNVGFNPALDEFFNAVNNSFNSGFVNNYNQQENFLRNQNPHFNSNYDEQYRNGNFQQQPQQNLNYRDNKIYDV